MTDTLAEIEKRFADDVNVQRIVEFFRNSKRGVYVGNKVTIKDEEE